MKNKYEFIQNVDNWDFTMIDCEEETLTKWDMYEILNLKAKATSVIADLGTGGGERIFKYYPKVQKIIATDLSPEMIATAKNNSGKSARTEVEFKVMDNLKMDLPKEYFDIVTARHTQIDPVQIYETLKPGGSLIIRGVDKLDCWELKKRFGKEQSFEDALPISLCDYNAILDANFRQVELVPIHVREYYKTKEDLLALLFKTPIINNLPEETDVESIMQAIDNEVLNQYIADNTYEKGILLIRRYYGITAIK